MFQREHSIFYYIFGFYVQFQDVNKYNICQNSIVFRLLWKNHACILFSLSQLFRINLECPNFVWIILMYNGTSQTGSAFGGLYRALETEQPVLTN